MLHFTRSNGTPVFVNGDKVLFVQPFRSAESPNTASQIYFSAEDFISLKDTYDEVIAKIDPTTSKPATGEIGL
jgi:hypothetical protein